jgi:hypothetical protein
MICGFCQEYAAGKILEVFWGYPKGVTSLFDCGNVTNLQCHNCQFRQSLKNTQKNIEKWSKIL